MKPDNGRVFSYADDTAIVFSGDTWKSVYHSAEKGLFEIANWLNAHLLALNISKTKYIAFTNYNTTQPGPNLTLKIHTCHNIFSTNCPCKNIEKVTHLKYLGIIVDQRLSWHTHTDMVMARTRKLIWIFKNLRYVTTKKMLTEIYVALAQSILIYCIPVWGGATKTKFLELERAQRSLIKVMYTKPYRFPTTELYSLSGILTVRKLYIIHAVLKLHKVLPYDPHFQERRRKYRVPVEFVKTKYAKRQFRANSAALYNKINKTMNIYPMTTKDCKKAIVQWLKLKTYDDIELLLQASSI